MQYLCQVILKRGISPLDKWLFFVKMLYMQSDKVNQIPSKQNIIALVGCSVLPQDDFPYRVRRGRNFLRGLA